MHTYYEEKAELVLCPQLGEGEAGRREKGKQKDFPQKQRQSNLPYSAKKTQGTKWICLSYSAGKIFITYIFLHSLLTHSVSCEAAEI